VARGALRNGGFPVGTGIRDQARNGTEDAVQSSGGSLTQLQEFVERFVIPAQLAISMVGMGATLRVRDFQEVLRARSTLAIGLLLQVLAAPILAVILTRAFDLSPGWAVGLALVAVAPGGAVSNLFTHLCGGNTALSVSLSLAGTAAAVLSIPLLLGVIVSGHVPPTFELPLGRIGAEIAPYLIAPLLVGMLLRHYAPRVAQASSPHLVRLALVLLLAIAVISLTSGRIQVLAYGATPPFVIILFGVVLSLLGAGTLVLFRWPDAVAVTLCMCVRNVGLALLLVHLFFADSQMQSQVLFTCLFYGGAQLFLAVPVMYSARVWSLLSRWARAAWHSRDAA
jgi:BASS family bile acid:Na+ symporter